MEKQRKTVEELQARFKATALKLRTNVEKIGGEPSKLLPSEQAERTAQIAFQIFG